MNTKKRNIAIILSLLMFCIFVVPSTVSAKEKYIVEQNLNETRSIKYINIAETTSSTIYRVFQPSASGKLKIVAGAKFADGNTGNLKLVFTNFNDPVEFTIPSNGTSKVIGTLDISPGIVYLCEVQGFGGRKASVAVSAYVD